MPLRPAIFPIIDAKDDTVFSILEKCSAIFKSNIDTQLASASGLMVEALENAGRFAELNMEIAKLSRERLSVAGKQLVSATEPQEFMTLIAVHAQSNVEIALSYVRRAVSIASRSHGELTRATEAQITAINRKVETVVDEATRNAPAGSQHAIALVKSVIGQAGAGYKRISNTAYQAVYVLEANVSMAASQVAQAVEENRRYARNYGRTT